MDLLVLILLWLAQPPVPSPPARAMVEYAACKEAAARFQPEMRRAHQRLLRHATPSLHRYFHNRPPRQCAVLAFTLGADGRPDNLRTLVVSAPHPDSMAAFARQMVLDSSYRPGVREEAVTLINVLRE